MGEGARERGVAVRTRSRRFDVPMAVLDEALVRALLARTEVCAVFLTDVRGTPRTWHPGVERLLGYTAEAWVGLDPGRLFGDELAADRAAVPPAGGAVACRLLHRTGERRALAGVVIPLQGNEGEASELAWVLAAAAPQGVRAPVHPEGLDVTARREAEEALRESERALRTAQRLAEVGSWTWELDGGAIRLSEELLRIYGYPENRVAPGGDAGAEPEAAVAPQPISAQWFLSIVHPDDREAVLSVGRALRHGQTHQARYEYRVVRPSGEVRACLGVAEAELDDAGVVRRVSGAVQDVTAMRITEAALREAQRVAGLGSWAADLATGRTEWSDELWRILGTAPYSFPPSLERFLTFVHPEDVGSVQATIEQALAERRAAWAFEARMVRADGTTRVCEGRGAATYDPAGEPVRLFGTLLDATEQRLAAAERRRLEARLQEVQRLESVGVLAAGVAHDFNNQLAGILGNADLLREHVRGGSLAEVLVDEIVQAARRSAELTRQLLTYAGKAPTVLAPVDVAELVRDVEPLLRSAAAASGSLALDVTGGVLVRGDRGQLTQLLLNLVTNAAEALPATGGRVEVRVVVEMLDATAVAVLAGSALTRLAPAQAGRHVRLEVRDTGAGMTAEVAERVFEPFFTTKFLGRGLGLAVTLGIVRAHEGGVAIDTAAGCGTTVRVWLPTLEEPEPPAGAGGGSRAAERPPAAPGAPTSDGARPTPAPRASAEPARDTPPGPTAPIETGATVLVVDEEPSLRRTVRRVLERAGLHVIEAAEAREALALLAGRTTRVDVVLLDQPAPGLGGVATLRELAERTDAVPVVLMSGYAEDTVRRWAGTHAAGFLAKPFSASEVLQQIRAALAARR